MAFFLVMFFRIKRKVHRDEIPFPKDFSQVTIRIKSNPLITFNEVILY